MPITKRREGSSFPDGLFVLWMNQMSRNVGWNQLDGLRLDFPQCQVTPVLAWIGTGYQRVFAPKSECCPNILMPLLTHVEIMCAHCWKVSCSFQLGERWIWQWGTLTPTRESGIPNPYRAIIRMANTILLKMYTENFTCIIASIYFIGISLLYSPVGISSKIVVFIWFFKKN